MRYTLFCFPEKPVKQERGFRQPSNTGGLQLRRYEQAFASLAVFPTTNMRLVRTGVILTRKPRRVLQILVLSVEDRNTGRTFVRIMRQKEARPDLEIPEPA